MIKNYEKVEEIGLPKREIIEKAKTRSFQKVHSLIEKLQEISSPRFSPEYKLNDKKFFELNEKTISSGYSRRNALFCYHPILSYKSDISKLVLRSENKRYGVMDLLDVFLISKKTKKRVVIDMLNEYLGLFDHADQNLYSTFWREFLDITKEEVKNVEIGKKYHGALSTLELKNKKYDNVWTPLSVIAGIIDDSNIKIERKLLKKRGRIDLLEKHPEWFVFKNVKDHKDISKNHDEVMTGEYEKVERVHKAEEFSMTPDFYVFGIKEIPLVEYLVYCSAVFKEIDVDFYDVGKNIVGIKVSPNFLKKSLLFDKIFRREKIETPKSMINRLKEDYKITIDVYISNYQNKKARFYEEFGEKEIDMILPKEGIVNLKYGNKESLFKIQDEDEFMTYLSVADNVFLRK